MGDLSSKHSIELMILRTQVLKGVVCSSEVSVENLGICCIQPCFYIWLFLPLCNYLTSLFWHGWSKAL